MHNYCYFPVCSFTGHDSCHCLCFFSATQKLAVSSEVQEKYPHYHLYLYGEGFVLLMCLTLACVMVSEPETVTKDFLESVN